MTSKQLKDIKDLKSNIIKLSQDPSNQTLRYDINFGFAKHNREQRKNWQVGDPVSFVKDMWDDLTGIITRIDNIAGTIKYTIKVDKTNEIIDTVKDNVVALDYNWTPQAFQNLHGLLLKLPPSPVSPSGSPLSPSGSTPIPPPPPGSFFGSLPPKKQPSLAPLPSSPPSPMTTSPMTISSIGGYNKYTRNKSNLSETSYYS